MKTSQYLLATLREDPSDAELASHRLMLRAGMIRMQASGLYTWLPTGLRVLKKVEKIVRESDLSPSVSVASLHGNFHVLWRQVGVSR